MLESLTATFHGGDNCVLSSLENVISYSVRHVLAQFLGNTHLSRGLKVSVFCANRLSSNKNAQKRNQ